MSLENLISGIKKGVKQLALISIFLAIFSCTNPSPEPEITPEPTFPPTPTPTLTQMPSPTGYDYTTTTKIVASENITPSGGSIEVTDPNSFLYGSKLTIPDEALDSNTTITIAEVNNPPSLPVGLGYVGSPLEIISRQTKFNSSLTIKIPYYDSLLSDAGISDDSNLELYSYNTSSRNWVKIQDTSIDTIKNAVTANIDHFSYYAITCLNAIPPEDLGTPKPGDLVYSVGAFWNNGDPILYNNWMPGHVGIYTGEKEYESGLASDDVKNFGIYNLVEAIWSGVQYSYYNLPNATETFESSLSSFGGGDLYMGAREPKNTTLTPQQRQDIVSYVEAQVGKPYAFRQTIGAFYGNARGSEVKGPFFNCVGLAEAAYEFAGVNNGEGLTTWWQEEIGGFFPAALTPAEHYNATKPAENINIIDRGPAGGWIFYDKGNYSDGWRYLEATPYDQLSRTWGTKGLLVSGADGTEIGTGKQNTLEIVAGDSLPNKAADECADLIIYNNEVSFDDWFLPSIDELNAMKNNLSSSGIGNFNGDIYWSSSEYYGLGTGKTAWCSYFNSNFSANNSKDFFHNIRAIRSF